ncbi:MAG: Hsp70 family protein, partial [Planctomycetales bacterium]|nr:Hsp70 family protein [Planctomycetales bacterium]
IVTLLSSGCDEDAKSSERRPAISQNAVPLKDSNPAPVGKAAGEPKVVFLRLPITDGSVERLKQEDVEEVLVGKIAFLRHGIGIKSETNRCHMVFESGQMVGCVKTLTLLTAIDNQNFIDISLVYGDSEIISECQRIGDIRIIELPPSKAGALKLDVTIEVKVDGTVEVYGRNKKTGTILAFAVTSK